MATPFQFLSLCDEIGTTMAQELAPLIGTEFGGEVFCLGADNTLTERIDRVAEELVLTSFREQKICRQFFSEEAGMIEIGGETGCAYLDPVDGTFNAVSDGEKMVVGYVKNLANGETLTAIRCEGAFLNGKPIQVSAVIMLDHVAMSVYAKEFDLTRMMQLGHKLRRLRLLGFSALELCYVVCGRLNRFVDMRSTLCITAASGILICQEAGGRVSLLDRSQVATNQAIHRKIIEYLRS